jgi:anaerobic magnesium-protoporphyrin IX monomethyl ester cyclase
VTTPLAITSDEGAPKPRHSLRIALIRPAAVNSTSAINAVTHNPPLALAYLASSLRRSGHAVAMIDAFGEAPDQVDVHPDGYQTRGLRADQVSARVPADVDLIGFTCMFSNEWIYCRENIERLAADFPGVPIILGGEHATADWERILRKLPAVTACALGEGEETLVELADRLSAGLPITDLTGLAVRDRSGKARRNAKRQRIRDVDAIPPPDWDGLPLDVYLERGFGHDAYADRSMPILASRGCPYQCTFCSSPQMFGTRWLVREPMAVVEEMRRYNEIYDARYFEFADLTLVIRRDWIQEFCRLLSAAKLPVRWSIPGGTRSEVLDAETLSAMKQAGCRSFSYAAESGSVEELRRIKKRVKIPRLLESMRSAVKLGIVVKTHLIFGLPDQSWNDVIRTFGFIVRVAIAGAHDVGCYAFSPYPGSELYARLIAEGRIDPEAPDYDLVLAHNVFTNYKLRRSWTQNLPEWSINPICLTGMAWFYGLQFLFRPWRIAQMVPHLRRAEPATYLERLLVRRMPGRGRKVA